MIFGKEISLVSEILKKVFRPRYIRELCKYSKFKYTYPITGFNYSKLYVSTADPKRVGLISLNFDLTKHIY